MFFVRPEFEQGQVQMFCKERGLPFSLQTFIVRLQESGVVTGYASFELIGEKVLVTGLQGAGPQEQDLLLRAGLSAAEKRGAVEVSFEQGVWEEHEKSLCTQNYANSTRKLVDYFTGCCGSNSK